MGRRAVVVIVAAAAAVAFGQRGARAADPSTYRTTSFAQTALDLDVTIDYQRPAVTGTATLTLVNRGKQPSSEVQLLLNRLMSIRGVRDAAGRRLRVRTAISIFEDEPLRQVLYARVSLPAAIAPGRSVTVKIAYGGALTGFVDAGNLYVKDRIDRNFTILREDALAFPRPGVPSERANLARVREDFRFRVRVTVPDGLVVATAGHLVDRHATDGRITFEFAGDPLPFLNIAVAPYRRIEQGGVQVYALPADEAKATTVVDATRQALARMESWYGPLAKAPRMTIIEIPDGFGSQANLNAGIILEAAAFRDRARLGDLYHEITHFWNPVELDAPSPRWNEGLARYLEYRLMRDLDGFNRTPEMLERARKRVCDPSLASVLRDTPFAQYGRKALSDHAYTVGLLMFSALDTLIGQEKLDGGLRAHIQTYLRRGNTTDQMVASLSGAASPNNLTPFFRDWMYTTAWVDRVCSAPSFEDAARIWIQTLPR